MDRSKVHVIRVARWTWILWGFILPGMSILIVYLSLSDPTVTKLDSVGRYGMAAGFLAPYFYICGTKVFLSDRELIYYRPFRKDKKIAWSEIKSVKSGMREMTGHSKAVYFMHLESTEGKKKAVEVNIKLFSKDDLAKLVDVIEVKSPKANLDRATKKMKEGRPPSVFG